MSNSEDPSYENNDSTDLLEMGNVSQELEELEEDLKKYDSGKTNCNTNESIFEHLDALSDDFDSVGLPAIDSKKSLTKIVEQLILNSKHLIGIHRNTLYKMRDTSLEQAKKDHKQKDLYNQIENCQIENDNLQKNCSLLKILNNKLKQYIKELEKRDATSKQQLQTVKTMYLQKVRHLDVKVSKQDKEIEKLKQICGQSIGLNNDAVFVEVLNKFKQNEEVYKSTIKQLQNKNQELMQDWYDMKASTYHKSSKDD